MGIRSIGLKGALTAILVAAPFASASQIAGLRVDSLVKLASDVQSNPDQFRYSKLALLLEQQAYPKLTGKKILKVEAELEKHAHRLFLKTRGLTRPEQKIAILNTYIHKTMGMRSDSKISSNPKSYFLHQTLKNKHGSCLGMCLVYLSLAERAHIPLRPARAPAHIYACYSDSQLTFDLETTNRGLRFDPKSYARSKGFSEAEARRHGHFATMKKTDLLADLLATLVHFSLKKKLPKPLSGERAVFAAKLAIQLSPRCYTNWDIYADALSAAGDAENALRAVEHALQRAPNLAHAKARRNLKEKQKLFRLEIRLAKAEQARISKFQTPVSNPRD